VCRRDCSRSVEAGGLVALAPERVVALPLDVFDADEISSAVDGALSVS
jgi:hypothetical protein